jgi:hypothetical protein
MAATSPVIIGRLALSHIGARANLESLDEQSPQAFQVKQWYDIAREQALEAFDWNFARVRKTLALHGDAPPTGQWGYRYQYPANVLYVRKLENPFTNVNNPIFPHEPLAGFGSDDVPFEIEQAPDGTRSLVTNLENAIAICTKNETLTNLFTPTFVQAMSHVLASHIAVALTGKRSIKESQIQMFFAIVAQAQALDANQQRERPPRDADWIRARS